MSFTEHIKDLLEWNPLTDPEAPVIVHGSAGDQILVSWAGETTTGPGTCFAVVVGNESGFGCDAATDQLPMMWRFTPGIATGAALVSPDTGWVEVDINGELAAWQLPRAGAVAFTLSASGGDRITIRTFDQGGGLFLQDIATVLP